MTNLTKKLIEGAFGALAMTALVMFFMFALLNWAMGCESWDQSYWTETNSCIYPSEFVMMFLPPYGG